MWIQHSYHWRLFLQWRFLVQVGGNWKPNCDAFFSSFMTNSFWSLIFTFVLCVWWTSFTSADIGDSSCRGFVSRTALYRHAFFELQAISANWPPFFSFPYNSTHATTTQDPSSDLGEWDFMPNGRLHVGLRNDLTSHECCFAISVHLARAQLTIHAGRIQLQQGWLRALRRTPVVETTLILASTIAMPVLSAVNARTEWSLSLYIKCKL